MLGVTFLGFENHWSVIVFCNLSVLKEKLHLVPEVLISLILVNPRTNPEVLLRPIVNCLKDSSGALSWLVVLVPAAAFQLLFAEWDVCKF